RGTSCALRVRPAHTRADTGGDERHRLHQAPRQHRAPARRHGIEDRFKGVSEARAEGLRLTDRQRLNWLRLIRTDNVGPATFRDLVNRFGSAEAAIEMLPELSARGGNRHVRITTVADAERELDTARRFGARFVAIGEPDYPPLLRRADQPPPLLALAGDAAVLHAPAVAIVGARNASAAGTRFAATLASELG